jgi:aminoglycoside phosphotransferase family enzyme/predicted kinase
VTGSWDAAVAETHSATVVFLGDRAFKVKKPIDLGFLDFRTVGARRAACHEEVRLNRRMAPDVYLGVADVLGVDGEVADHLVVMRRMPADRRLSTLVRTGADVDSPLRDVAHQLATLHARSPRSDAADEAASTEATRGRWNDNGESMRRRGDVFDEFVVESVLHLANRYLDGRSALLDDRVAAGRAVDGHGDLLADDIFCLDDGPRVLDCLDFDPRLRLGDGLADAAFLAMDLDHLGRPDLGRRFLDTYADCADDAWPPSLAHHQIAYRAQVRAKVASIRATQGDLSAASRARHLLALSESHLYDGSVRLVLVGGLPGTGKSTIADLLGDRLDAIVIRSDEVRRELGSGSYAGSAKEAVYDGMLERARTALARGYTVVLDATWGRRAWRARAAALAAAGHADLTQIRCCAPADVAAARIERRGPAGSHSSEATPAVARALALEWEHWPEATPVDSSGSLEQTADLALAAIGRHNGTRH